MKQELPNHGFQFRTLSGSMPMKARAKALRDFQQDPPTTIFLLSMRAGAVGINLTQANRVFLMEPAMNPALEAQAIGRVYRLGQRKSVQITKFIMENSFETRLLNVTERKFGHGNKTNDAEAATKKENSDGNQSSSANDTKSSSSQGKNPSTTSSSMDGDDAEDRKPAAVESADSSEGGAASSSSIAQAQNQTVVGHVHRDKISSTVADFDELFGV